MSTVSYLCILFLVISVSARPIRRHKRSVKCLVDTDIFRGDKTPCGGGHLQKMSEVQNEAAATGTRPGTGYGAENLADVILSRLGIFDYEKWNLDGMHICAKHKKELGYEWVDNVNNRPKMSTRNNQPRCNMPSIDGLPSPHPRETPVSGQMYLNKEQSKTIFLQKLRLTPIGTAMCRQHSEAVKALVTQNTQEVEREEAPRPCVDTIEAGPSQRREEGSATATGRDVGGHLLRQQPDKCYIESPVRHKTWLLTKRGQDTPTGSSQQSIKSTPDSQEQREIASDIKAGIQQIAKGIGLATGKIHAPEKPWSELGPDMKYRRASIATQITDAVAQFFAPDAQEEILELIFHKGIGNAWYKQPSEQFLGMMENIIEQYASANTRLARMETLGLIAPLFHYEELERYMPGLTRYAYREARRHAKLSKEGLFKPAAAGSVQRYNRAKVELFIAFITSSAVVSDTPFGQLTVRLSTGIKQELPNMIRHAIDQRIIDQYNSYLKDTGHYEDMKMSPSTMRRILDACKATTRKSLLGLDYYSFSGLEGISNLMELVDQIRSIDGDATWAKEITKALGELKTFFKGDYKVYIQEESDISDYSRFYALSDPKVQPFQAPNPGTPAQKRRCAQCIVMMQTFAEIREKIACTRWQDGTAKSEAEYVLDQSQTNILEWQKHIMRTINQQQAKEHILQNLEPNAVFVLMDWAMKFLPRKGIESQTDWYGKRGISWHISVAFVRNPETNHFAMREYVHIFDKVAQDSETVLAVIQDVLKRVKSEKPHTQKAYLRSDNAGCYHSGPTMAAMSKMQEETGIKVDRYDFSEPQSGKDSCDRATSTIKRHVHQWVDQNHRCTTAAEFFLCANSFRGVKGATFIHAGLRSGSDSASAKGSIGEITRVHNFEFKEGGKIHGWYAYKIGTGKDLAVVQRLDPLPKLDPIYSVGTHGNIHPADQQLLTTNGNWVLVTVKPIPANQRQQQSSTSQSEDISVPDDTGGDQPAIATADPDDPDYVEGFMRQRLFQCDVEGCTKVYQTFWNWFRHVTVGKHTLRLERQTLRDFSIEKYVEKLQENQALSSMPHMFSAIQSQRDQEARNQASVPSLPMGWALKTKKPTKRFTLAQRQYLTDKFNEGARTKRKFSPQETAKQMRREPQFPSKEDWLTWTQIQSFWSRLAREGERASADIDIEIDMEEIQDDPDVNGATNHFDEVFQAVMDSVTTE